VQSAVCLRLSYIVVFSLCKRGHESIDLLNDSVRGLLRSCKGSESRSVWVNWVHTMKSWETPCMSGACVHVHLFVNSLCVSEAC